MTNMICEVFVKFASDSAFAPPPDAACRWSAIDVAPAVTVPVGMSVTPLTFAVYTIWPPDPANAPTANGMPLIVAEPAAVPLFDSVMFTVIVTRFPILE